MDSEGNMIYSPPFMKKLTVYNSNYINWHGESAVSVALTFIEGTPDDISNWQLLFWLLQRQAILPGQRPARRGTTEEQETEQIIFWYFSQIDHLLANLLSFRGLITDWIGFSETIANIVQEKEF